MGDKYLSKRKNPKPRAETKRAARKRKKKK